MERYIIRRSISAGREGTKVLLASDKYAVADRDTQCVIKMVPLGGELEVTLRREIDILSICMHSNIVAFREYFAWADCLVMVIDYCEGGDLLDLINGGLRECSVYRIFGELVNVVEFLHLNGYIHRDIKPDNIFLTRQLCIKFGDFGFSDRWTPGKYIHTKCGTIYYVAPEILMGELFEGPEPDVWAVGVLLYAMITVQLPFIGNTPEEVMVSIVTVRVRYPAKFPQWAKQICQAAFTRDPRSRPNIHQLSRLIPMRPGPIHPPRHPQTNHLAASRSPNTPARARRRSPNQRSDAVTVNSRAKASPQRGNNGARRLRDLQDQELAAAKRRRSMSVDQPAPTVTRSMGRRCNSAPSNIMHEFRMHRGRAPSIERSTPDSDVSTADKRSRLVTMRQQFRRTRNLTRG